MNVKKRGKQYLPLNILLFLAIYRKAMLKALLIYGRDENERTNRLRRFASEAVGALQRTVR